MTTLAEWRLNKDLSAHQLYVKGIFQGKAVHPDIREELVKPTVLTSQILDATLGDAMVDPQLMQRAKTQAYCSTHLGKPELRRTF